MSLKEELEKIIHAERPDAFTTGQRDAASGTSQRAQLDEVRPLFEEFADAVDESFVRVRIADTRVVIDVGDTASDADSFEIDGRWELEPNPELRFLAEPGAEVFRPKSRFVIRKTLYLRPLMEPENLTWDRIEFDNGVDAFQYVFQDVAKQIARHRRLHQVPDGTGGRAPNGT